MRRLHESLQIDINGIGQPFAFRVNDQHLSRVNENGFAEAVVAKNPAGAFEDDELGVGIGVILKHHGGAGDRRSDGGRFDLRAAVVFRHPQEHDAAAELKVTRAFVETENGVRAKASNSSIGKSQLGPRINAGAHRSAVANVVAKGGRSGRGLGRKKLDVFDDLRDTRLF
jgi:hypothetical protein